MAENDNGRLNFGIGIDLDELKRGSDEARGLFDGIASEAQAKGADIDRAFGTDAARGASSLSSAVRQSLSEIARSCEEHEAAIASLEGEYSRLGREMSKAYETGRDGDLAELQQRAAAVKAEISVRRELLTGLREQADALEQEAERMEGSRRQTDALGESHSSLRQRIRELQEQMAQLREQGIDETSGAYRELTAELGRLRDIQSDIQKQGSVLANDQAQFQGIISGLQGISGGYTAVSGAMSLFGTKNEDLNKIMAKAQSLMSITIGLQQVSQMLDKDSAFQLTTVAKVREWWNKLLDVGRGKTAANTAAVELNTAAHKGNAGAVRTAGAAQQMENTIAETGTAANIGLAGAFRMVGAAIKSVPVFGWIATAITAIVTVLTHFTSKAKEAREAAEEFNKSVAEMAAEPVASMMKLYAQWNSLGDSMEAKQKFINDNTKAFEELGLAIRDVNDAEAVFTSTETLQNYINAQLTRAKADQTYKDATELIKKQNEATLKLEEAQENLAKAQETPTVTQYGFQGQVSEAANPEIAKYTKEVQKYSDEIDGYKTKIGEALESYNGLNKEANDILDGINKKLKDSADGASEAAGETIAALEQEYKRQEEIMKSAVIGSEEQVAAQKRVNEIQAQLDAARGKTSVAAKSQEQENKELERALTEEGRIMASLTKSNEQGRIAQMEDGHKQTLERIKYDYGQEMAEIEKQTEELRRINEQTGAETVRTSSGEDTGLTAEQLEQVTQARTNAVRRANEAAEAENERFRAETEKANADLLKGIETFEQKYTKIAQEYAERRASLYDDDGNLLPGVTEENVAMLENMMRKEFDALGAEYGAWFAQLNAANYETLKDAVEQLTETVIQAEDALFQAESAGADEETLTQLRMNLLKVTNQLTAAERKLNESQDGNDNKNRKNGESTAEFGRALGELGNEVRNVGEAFGDLGDQIGGALGDALGDIGRVTDKIGSVIGSIGEFIEVGIGGIQSMEWEGISAIQAVENASTLLAMVGTVVKMVNAIAGLFNNDDKRQEEIDALQDRIDQLQWELDNAEAVRIRNATGSAYSVTSELYKQALADAKAANKEGQSYVSMLAEWTKAADKAKASDVAHERTVEGLIKTYTSLGYSVDKAIGEDKYKAVGDTVKNYAEQMALVQEQYEKEESKKKSDKSALQDYENEMEELAQSIVDTLNSAMEDIIGGSYEDIAKQLGDAFVDAFEAGEDAAEAWGDTVEDIVNDIVRQMLIQQWIEPEIAKIFDKYMNRWFFTNDEGELEYAGNSAVVDSMEEFSEELNGAMYGFADAWAEIAEAMGWLSDSTREAATRGIASASQESIDELNGRMTAIQGHTFSINDNVAILVSTNNLILQSVVNIEGNTDRLVAALEEAADEAADIHETLDEMQLKGVKVK